MKDRQRANEKVCIIAGAGHSGSTVLGMVLGSHPRCFYAGEAGKTRYLHDPRKDERKRVCKMCGADCPIWTDFHVPHGVDLYEQISRVTGCGVVVDSTKGLDWIDERLAELDGTGSEAVLLFLQRDGRAVINSRVRKYPDRDPREQIERWARQLRGTRALFDRFEGPKAIVRYERFATEPAEVTGELCHLLGIDFTPTMLEFYRSEQHPLGGNNGAQFLVARVHGARSDRPYAKLSARNRAYYEHHEEGIRLDTRWREEMPADVHALFEEIAGTDNEELRWEGF